MSLSLLVLLLLFDNASTKEATIVVPLAKNPTSR
jgi:hypothetical protein